MVSNVHADCGCTAVDLQKRELSSGESTTMSVTFDSVGSMRQVKKRVVLESNDAQHPVTVISLVGYVKVGVRVDPPNP